MTRLEPIAGSAAQAGFGTLFSTLAALTSPVQGKFERPFYGDVPPLGLRGRSGARRLLDAFWLWHQRARRRRQLLELNEHLLRDIGITRADALGEAEKPFWRV